MFLITTVSRPVVWDSSSRTASEYVSVSACLGLLFTEDQGGGRTRKANDAAAALAAGIRPDHPQGALQSVRSQEPSLSHCSRRHVATEILQNQVLRRPSDQSEDSRGENRLLRLFGE